MSWEFLDKVRAEIEEAGGFANLVFFHYQVNQSGSQFADYRTRDGRGRRMSEEIVDAELNVVNPVRAIPGSRMAGSEYDPPYVPGQIPPAHVIAEGRPDYAAETGDQRSRGAEADARQDRGSLRDEGTGGGADQRHDDEARE
jgi:hypothetical protein